MTLSLDRIKRLKPQIFDIHIASDGLWFHEGDFIGRPALVKLFASALRRETDGTFWLATPVERGQITVADAPFIGVILGISGQGLDQQITITTNVGDAVLIDHDHPLRMQAGEDTEARPYVLVRDGLDAKLSRPVFYELAALAVPDDDGQFGVWSAGTFFPLMD